MYPFDLHLNTIANKITIKDEDRPVYTKNFDRIRDYIFDCMCALDPVFNQIYKGHSLFGSYSNNVRILRPSEFDVHFKLCFPYASYISVEEDEIRPGFVLLDFEDVMDELEDHPGYEDLYERLEDLVDWDTNYLRRSNLQRWLSKLIRKGLKHYGRYVDGYNGDRYKLTYSKRGLAHTIFAECASREISIDLIPAIVFGERDWMQIPTYYPFTWKCKRWFAIPKPAADSMEHKNYAFMICNPKAEHDLLLNNQNLKVIFRLLKSLRNAYGLKRLKSYFITTAFLWEILVQETTFWQHSLSYLFVHMLDVLHQYFECGELPFFWNEDRNLLDILSEEEIEEYTEQLRQAYNTLSSYTHQPGLTLARIATHFELP